MATLLAPEGPKPDNRRRALFGAGLLFLGLAGGAAIRAVFSGRDATEAPGDAAAFGPKLNPKAAAAWERFLSSLSAKQGERASIGHLERVFSDNADDTVGQKFAADFARDPKLMEIWNEYSRSQNTLNVPWLIRRLSQSRAFAELLNKHSSDPGLAYFGDSLVQQIAEAASQGGAKDSSAREGSSRAEDPGGPTASRDSGQRQEKPVLRAMTPVQGGPPAQPDAQLIVAAEVPQEPGAQAQATAAQGGPEPGDAPDADVKRGVSGARKAEKKESHDVTTLKKPEAAGPDADAVDFIASMFATMRKSESDTLINLCLRNDICDPVAACDKADLYASCLAACDANPKCKGRLPPTPPSDDDPPATAITLVQPPVGDGGGLPNPGPPPPPPPPPPRPRLPQLRYRRRPQTTARREATLTGISIATVGRVATATCIA